MLPRSLALLSPVSFAGAETALDRLAVPGPEHAWMDPLGRGDHAGDAVILHGESTEAERGTDPTGRKRDLRFEYVIEDAEANVQRIHVRYPGVEEYLFVEQRITLRD